MRDDKRLSAANGYYNVWTAGEPGRRVLTLKAWDDHGIYAEDKWTFYVKGTKTVSSDIKFAGTVIEPDNGYLDDLFDCKVKIDRIITDPGNIDIKEGDEVLIEKFIFCDPGGTVDEWYVKVDDSVEVYGKISKGDFSLSGHSDSSFLVDLCGSFSYYFIQKELSRPDPEITKVTYPTMCVKESEDATISVTVENNGGTSSEGYISVSFPNDETISNVYGTGDRYNKLIPKGSTIWGKYSQMTSYDPLVELEEFQWGKDQQEKITMSVKPNSGSDKIVFYVRAALKNDADGSYERNPTYSGNKDQQGWYVKKYEIAVCQEKPAPEIIKVTYPSTCVTEDEEAEISVTVKNNGGTSSEGYISVSFPNDETISNVYGTGDGYNKLIPKGSTIWDKYGQMTSHDPLVELEEFQWGKDQQEKITMSIKPNSGSDKIVFYVRAALKSDADGTYERDPSYSGNKDQQGWYVKKYSVDVCEYEEVKFRGKILADYPIISFYSFDIKIDEVIDDPTGNLQKGETVNVYGHRDGPAHVDDVTVGDEVEVYGEYRGYVGTYEQIFLSDYGESSSDHYVKKSVPLAEIVDESIILPNEDYTAEDCFPYNIEVEYSVKNIGNKKRTFYLGYSVRDKNEKWWDAEYRTITLNPWEQSAKNLIWPKGLDLNAEAPAGWYDVKIAVYEKRSNGELKNELDSKYYEDCFFIEKPIAMQSPAIPGMIQTSGDSESGRYTFYWISPRKDDVVSVFTEKILFVDNSRYDVNVIIKFRNIDTGSEYEIFDVQADVKSSKEEILRHLRNVEPVPSSVSTFPLLKQHLEAEIGELVIFTSEYDVTNLEFNTKLATADDSISIEHSTTEGVDIKVWGHSIFELYDKFKDLTKTKDEIKRGESPEIPDWMKEYTHSIWELKSPAQLHIYDSEGRHVGINTVGGVDEEIPNVFLSRPDTHPQTVFIFGQFENMKIVVKGTESGKFSLVGEVDTPDRSQKIEYNNVPIYTNTIAEIDITPSNPDYTMKIDEDGDGTPEYEKKPDSIEPIACIYDHDGDGIVEDDIDDLIMAADAYLGFNTGSEYDADGDGIVEDDIDDLIMATDAYLGFITCEGEER